MLILASNEYTLYNIFPILGNGLGKTLNIGVQRSSVYAEVVVLGVVAASLQGSKNIKRAGVISVILSGLLIAAGLLAELLLFSYETAKENSAPLYALSRMIKYGVFFTRLDPLFLILWSTALVITVSVLFYAAVSMFCQSFHLPDKRPVIVPMTIILFAAAMAPRDFTTIVFELVEGARRANWIVFFGLPMIALITAVIRKKKGGSANA